MYRYGAADKLIVDKSKRAGAGGANGDENAKVGLYTLNAVYP